MDFKYLDQYLENRKERLPFLGATVSVGNETVYSRVLGNKNDQGELYDEHTPLFIYSITKTFTTLCGMLLIETSFSIINSCTNYSSCNITLA